MVNKHGMTTLHPSKLYWMFRSGRVNCRLTRDASIASSYHKRSARRVARRSIANSCLKGRRSTGQAPNALWRPELGIKYLVFQVAFQSCTVCSLANTCCLSNSFASRRDTHAHVPSTWDTFEHYGTCHSQPLFPHRDPYSQYCLVSPTLSYETPQIIMLQCILHVKLACPYKGSRPLTHESA